MNTYFKRLEIQGKNAIILSIVLVITAISILLFILKTSKAEAEPSSASELSMPGNNSLSTVQKNSLLPVSEPSFPERASKTVMMVVTAYSSTTWQTDDTPFITASGKMVADGIVANNMLPFGTKVRIPDLYGDKIFVVEDRMSWLKSNYHLDIWFPDYWQALNFGSKIIEIEVLGS